MDEGGRMTIANASWIKTITIVLGEAGTATPALAIAKSLARGMEVPIHVVYGMDGIVPLEEVPRIYHLSPEDLVGTVLKGVLGTAPEAILSDINRSQGPLLIATMNESRPPGGRLNPVTQAALSRADFPVLLVPRERAPEEWRPREILLPYDGSPEAACALEPVADLARWARSTLSVLHVSVRKDRGRETPGTVGAPRFIDYPQHDWPEWTREFLDRLRSQGGIPQDIVLRLQFALGSPGEEIAGWARRNASDLVVLSWHREIGPGRAETLKEVLERATCPVLCLPVLKRAVRSAQTSPIP
jgi:nucleotide-binding universal stress UspA family protein